MLMSVPRFSSECNGTGTVTVVSGDRFCIIQWLPRRRTSRNPCAFRSSQTSSPERIRSLPNRNLDLCHEYSRSAAPFDFVAARRLEEQGQSLDQVCTRLFD